MSIQRIQQTDTKRNNNIVKYSSTITGMTIGIGHEIYHTKKDLKTEINGFRILLKYLYENPIINEYIGKIDIKDLGPEIKKIKEPIRARMKETKKLFPRRVIAKSIIGVVIGYFAGHVTCSMMNSKNKQK